MHSVERLADLGDHQLRCEGRGAKEIAGSSVIHERLLAGAASLSF